MTIIKVVPVWPSFCRCRDRVGGLTGSAAVLEIGAAVRLGRLRALGRAGLLPSLSRIASLVRCTDGLRRVRGLRPRPGRPFGAPPDALRLVGKTVTWLIWGNHPVKMRVHIATREDMRKRAENPIK